MKLEIELSQNHLQQILYISDRYGISPDRLVSYWTEKAYFAVERWLEEPIGTKKYDFNVLGNK